MQKWLLKKIHISWIIAWTSIGIVLGTALSVAISSAIFASVVWLVVAGSLLFTASIKRVALLFVAALCAGVIIGLWRGTIEQSSLKAYNLYFNTHVVLQGKVHEDASFGPKGDQRITLAAVQINQQKLPGNVWVSTPSKLVVKRGDTVIVEGKLGKGFGTVPASLYYAKVVKVARPYPGDIARRIRDWFADGVRRAVPSPQADLGVGYLVGQRSTLPETLDDQLKMIGLTHVVVASGYNLTILVRFARRLFARVSKYLAVLTSGIMIFCFMCVTGFSPSMSRAGLVTGLSLLVWYYGRKIHPFVLLPFAAAITTLFNPSYAWGDIGWLLSFLSFAGVILLAPLVHHYFWGRTRQPGVLRQTLVDTMSAQLMTLPLMIFVFGQYSIYALPANLLVLPLIPLTMVLTFFAGLGGLFAPTAAVLIGEPARLLLQYMTTVVDRIARLPGASNEVSLPLFALLGGYTILLVMMVYLRKATKHDFRGDSVVE